MSDYVEVSSLAKYMVKNQSLTIYYLPLGLERQIIFQRTLTRPPDCFWPTAFTSKGTGSLNSMLNRLARTAFIQNQVNAKCHIWWVAKNQSNIHIPKSWKRRLSKYHSRFVSSCIFSFGQKCKFSQLLWNFVSRRFLRKSVFLTPVF